MSPRARYERDLQAAGFIADAAQSAAVDALQRIHDELVRNPPRKRLFRQKIYWPPVRGLYMWGGVGRGKTWLMDAFYDSLDGPYKRRTHFHRFMLDVHARRRHFSDQQDPLRLIALEVASEIRVLCFDEFFVSDIADAMILGRLVEVLFEEGVTIVGTSNCAPDELYRDGLQRENFLPAIDNIKRNMQVLNVDSGTDYRLRQLTHAPLYLHPSDANAIERLSSFFREMAGGESRDNVTLDVDGRPIPALRIGNGVAWFDFAAVCEGPRSAADYIEMAREYHTVLVSGIPVLNWEREDAARRFIHLVDEFYDRGVKLMLAAEVPQEKLYQGKRSQFEFRRTLSRLQEMQSEEYLARPHLP